MEFSTVKYLGVGYNIYPGGLKFITVPLAEDICLGALVASQRRDSLSYFAPRYNIFIIVYNMLTNNPVNNIFYISYI